MIKLSGGQRARLSLARAVYARTDLCVAWLSYMIDKSTKTSVIGSYLTIVLLPWTVMSPAMSLVCSLFKLAGSSMLNVLDNVIGPQGLLASKARIFVTNSIAFVRQFDHLVYLRHGYVIESGSYYELVANSDSEISKLMYAIRFERCNVSLTFSFRRDHGKSSHSSGSSTPYPTTSGTATPRTEEPYNTAEEKSPTRHVLEKYRQRASFPKPRLISPTLSQLSSTGKGLSVEHQEQGKVKTLVYQEYIKAASIAGFVFFLLTTIAQQATSVLATFTLRYWGEHNGEQGSNDGMLIYLIVYGLFSLSSCLLGGVSSILMWVFCALRSARRLHDAVSPCR